ncbi:folate-sensitive fragile site protein Fra10Ac1-domain-containing protein [Kockovaella imperatae]|uniref:Folate-sensitive fragile site protein Fra10Ac1-domain-containing protein n=1 Tax=Kockovaella imperatae TaxID=4999 RepID=A0A1Y1U7Z0_9TREE|nr:folate-sensitive fragile site protein Fra10Ac1-domain-containing protein [Kockovaella imperatae]ORX34150.1 folate-sensitive fragile site protein Fra10Ac1-domain-containing protein [Kockovaella imperatae]
MSWKSSGQLVKGPLTSSNHHKLDPRYRPNLGGLTAFQREQQLARHYGSGQAGPSTVKTEWDVLKENHRFIRDDEEPGDVSWEERLARAYESKLFKEFALIDLKHYKSRRLALRWRTAPEVVDGIGEDTCGSLRCKYHKGTETIPSTPQVDFDDIGPSISERRYDPGEEDRARRKKKRKMPALRSFELPFVYEEAGQRKEALVKVRLCPRCQAKLTWKPGKEVQSDSEDEAEQRDERIPGSRDEDSRRYRQDQGAEPARDGARHSGRSHPPSRRRTSDFEADDRARSRSPPPRLARH